MKKILTFVNISIQTSKLFFYGFYMSVCLYVFIIIRWKSMRVNAVNYGNEMQVLKRKPKQKEQNPNLNQNFGKSSTRL